MASSRFARSPARELLPRAVTCLGELSGLLIQTEDGKLYGLRGKVGQVLVASEDGRRLFIVRPQYETRLPSGREMNAQAVRCAKLYERFMHRRADSFYNAAVPAFRHPRYLGALAGIRYIAQKDDDLLETGTVGDDDLVEYEHVFEHHGRAAYGEIYTVGRDQFYVPPGPWAVFARGIDWAEPPHRQERDHGEKAQKAA